MLITGRHSIFSVSVQKILTIPWIDLGQCKPEWCRYSVTISDIFSDLHSVSETENTWKQSKIKATFWKIKCKTVTFKFTVLINTN
jgi:hypothetical protein